MGKQKVSCEHIIIFVIAVLTVLIIMIMIRDNTRYTVTEYTIEDNKIKKHYTLVMISDLHNKVYGDNNSRLIEDLNRLEPDGVFLAGDMITSIKGESTESTSDFINRLTKCYEVYYGLGNHEHRLKVNTRRYGNMWEEYIARLNTDRLHILENDSIYLQDYNINIVGLDLGNEYLRRSNARELETDDLDIILGKNQVKSYSVLIAHVPEYYKAYDSWGANLILSGHLHGGLVRVPIMGGLISPRFKIFPKYTKGLYFLESSNMIVSAGIGMHTLPIRINNPGEMVVVHLMPCK